MHWLTGCIGRMLFPALFALAALDAGAAAQAADDHYYVVPLIELHTVEGTLPASEGGTWNRWQRVRAETLRPSVTLDGPGEAYLQLPADWQGGPGYVRLAVLAVRAPAARDEAGGPKAPPPVQGRLALPKSDLSGMAPIRFTIPAAAARGDAEIRRRFHEAEESHFGRLLDAGLDVGLDVGLVGGAWFRHRLRQARIAQGKPPDLPSGSQTPSLDDTFSLLAPERGFSERLPLTIAGLAATKDEPTLPLKSLRAVLPRPFPAAEAPQQQPPAIDVLAPRVPHDQYAILFPSFGGMVGGMDEWDSLGTELMAYFLGNAADRQIGPWYRRQMCIEVTPLDRLLGPKLVASAALTGSDPYFDVGTDVAVLFEAKNVEGVQKYFRAKQQVGKLATPGAEEVSGTVAGVEYVGFRSPDRRICSYLFTMGNVVGVTNSLVQLRRLVETAQEKTPNLAGSAEYRLFRGRHPRGEETGFLVLPEAALRQWLSPRWRVASSRRTRAAAWLNELQAEQLDDLVAGRIEPAGRAISREIPGLGKLSVHPGGVRSSLYGTLEFMTPIAELEIGGVSQAEADAYHRWRGQFAERWQGFVAPLALQVTAKPERISLSASMLPMPDNGRVQAIARLAGKAALAQQDISRGPDGILHAAAAFDVKSELWRNLGQFMDLFLGIAGSHRSVGPAVSIHCDESPAWARLAAAANPAAFWQGRDEELPLTVEADVADFEMSRRILASFHRQKRVLFGSSFTREARRHEGLDYFKVQGGFLGDEVPKLYEAAGPAGLMISLGDASVRRALERQLVGKSRHSGPGEAPPLLGQHLAINAQRTAMDVAERLLGTDVERRPPARSWSNLPILEEWRRRYPKEDPVALHQRFWHVALECPGGGKYAAATPGGLLESTVFGRPADPRKTDRKAGPLDLIRLLRLGATFEKNGLAMRAEIDRAAVKQAAGKSE